MAVEYTLLMQKAKDGSAVKSSLADFGLAVCQIPWPSTKIKEPAKRSWPGKHGEDVFMPSVHKLEAYDLTVEFSHKGKLGADNLLNGTNRGKNGWSVVYAQNENGDDVTAQVQPWTCRKSYIKNGDGLGLSTGAVASTACIGFKSDGWPLKPGGVYTLSFSLVSGSDMGQMDVHLGKTWAWADMATNFVRVQPRLGFNRYSLKFTVSDAPATGDSLHVAFRPVMSGWPTGSGLELFDLKLEEGEVSETQWNPSPADADAGYFPQWWPAYTAYRHLRDYLIGMDGEGTELRVYDPYWRRGRQRVSLLSIDDFVPARSNADEVLTFTATFRVYDPITEIRLDYVGD